MSSHYFPLKFGVFQGLVDVDLSFRVSFRDRLGVLDRLLRSCDRSGGPERFMIEAAAHGASMGYSKLWHGCSRGW